MKLSLSNKSNLNSNVDNLYKNINSDKTEKKKNKQRKKETHVKNRTKKKGKLQNTPLTFGVAWILHPEV